MFKLAKRGVPKEMHAEVLSSNKGIQEWLSGYAEEIYAIEEVLQFETWTTARDLASTSVEALLERTGLKDLGYKPASMDEVRLQMKWKTEGDWRYGSSPDSSEDETPKEISEMSLDAVYNSTIEQHSSLPMSWWSAAQKTTGNVCPGLQLNKQQAVYSRFNNPCCNPIPKEPRTTYDQFFDLKGRNSRWNFPQSGKLVAPRFKYAAEGPFELSITAYQECEEMMAAACI